MIGEGDVVITLSNGKLAFSIGFRAWEEGWYLRMSHTVHNRAHCNANHQLLDSTCLQTPYCCFVDTAFTCDSE